MDHLQLRELRLELTEHFGAINEIAKRAGVGRGTVTQILRGMGKKTDVLEIAIQVLQERKEKKALVDSRLTKKMEEVKQRQADLFSQPN